ncbi:MAG: hypothetical protein INR73_03830 [Williamsia sp.]|nr:hypothetical protein [Williamsia sp.]
MKLPPGRYCLDIKLRKPWKRWSSIAVEADYFDQMHLVKDFKRFSGAAPANFLEKTPLSQEEYISRVKV